MAAWVSYGAALNEGREEFPKGDNTRFSEWVASIPNGNLPFVEGHDRAAAMWADANPEAFKATRKALGLAHTNNLVKTVPPEDVTLCQVVSQRGPACHPQGWGLHQGASSIPKARFMALVIALSLAPALP